MDRKKFISSLGLAGFLLAFPKSAISQQMESKEYYFKDDGKIPNSKFPLILYKNAFAERNNAGAEWLEIRFAQNNWTNSWRNGINSFHHYHSTSHEVLGVYAGEALVHLGGENGEKIKIKEGDIIIIPAGVGHKNLGGSNLGIVGAYPDGRSWDINKGIEGERPAADKNIAALPIPEANPLSGKSMPSSWTK
tara:strand:+ start:968 stop:1543 length:576 start_codon:yes stop_codon:yes gene_type:complete